MEGFMKISKNIDLIKTKNKLSFAISITSIGDYISLFAYIVAIDQLTSNPIVAALVIPCKSIGSAIGSLCSPYLFRLIDNRIGLVLSQFILFVFSFMIATLFKLQIDSFLTGVILLFSVLHGVLAQYFQNAKESYSKTIEVLSIDKNNNQLSSKSLITALENGVLLGQLFGSVIFLLLFYKFKSSMYLAIYFDSLSFFIAGIICIGLANLKLDFGNKFEFLDLINYVFENSSRKYIFLFRIFLWVPYGIFNIVLFGIVKDTFSLPIEYTAALYSIGGLVSFLLNKFNPNFLNKINSYLLFIGMLTYASTISIFSNQSSLGLISVIAIIFNTYGCTLIKIASRDILRQTTTERTFGDVISIEFVFGKIVEAIVAYTCYILSMNKLLSYPHAIYFAAGTLCLALPIVFKFKNFEVKNAY
jgi:MFS family permease